MIRRLLARFFGRPDWRADPEFIRKLQAEAQSQRGIAGERRDELAAEMLADGLITPTQHDRMIGRESATPPRQPRPTAFARKLARVK